MKTLLTLHIVLVSIRNCEANQKEICSVSGPCLPENYNKQTLPFTNKTNDVYIEFLDLKILNINDYDCTIKWQIGLNISWIEPRLILKKEEPNSLWIVLEQPFIESLWKPDIFIQDLKSARIPSFIREYHSMLTQGFRMNFIALVEVVTYCPTMNFDNFPFDSHKCYFMVS